MTSTSHPGLAFQALGHWPPALSILMHLTTYPTPRRPTGEDGRSHHSAQKPAAAPQVPLGRSKNPHNGLRPYCRIPTLLGSWTPHQSGEAYGPFSE